MPFPIQLHPGSAAREVAQLTYKATESLARLREEQIQFGVTPKEAVYQEDNVVLYRYTPVVAQPFRIPLLICYALVNRPYMVDLQEDRSLVRGLLNKGIDVYLIDWGYPEEGDRWLTIDDHVNGYLNNCVDVIRARHGIEQINLLGICQGGTFSACYAALYPEKIKNLVTMVAPIDFNIREGLLNVWAGAAYGPQSMDVDLLVDAMGNIPGDFMNFGFLMLKPFQLNVEKYVGLADVLDDEAKLINFLRMEKWIFDSPNQAGETIRQFLKDLYQQNKLIKGEFEIGERRVDLHNITMPVLNVFAEQDHLVPPPSSMALAKQVGTSDYTEKGFPVGHIGMYVSGKVQNDLPPLIASWLQERA